MNEDKDWTFEFAPTENDIAANRENMKIICAKSTFIEDEQDNKETASFTTKLIMNGYVPLDSPAWAGNNIDVDLSGTNNRMTLNRVGLTA